MNTAIEAKIRNNSKWDLQILTDRPRNKEPGENFTNSLLNFLYWKNIDACLEMSLMYQFRFSFYTKAIQANPGYFSTRTCTCYDLVCYKHKIKIHHGYRAPAYCKRWTSNLTVPLHLKQQLCRWNWWCYNYVPVVSYCHHVSIVELVEVHPCGKSIVDARIMYLLVSFIWASYNSLILVLKLHSVCEVAGQHGVTSTRSHPPNLWNDKARWSLQCERRISLSCPIRTMKTRYRTW